MKTSSLIPCLLALAGLLAARLASSSANLVVTNLADSGPGTLRSALTNAASGAVITFDPSLSGATNILTNGELLIPTNLTIDASALPGGFNISGNQSLRVFELAANTVVTVNSLTIQHGNIVGNGGGILLNSGASLALANCTLSGNSATNAGALQGNGGGIYVNPGASLTLTNCTVSGNSANVSGEIGLNSGGGGICFFGDTLTISGSTFTNNSVLDPNNAASYVSGGGICFFGDALRVNGSTFYSNSVSSDYMAGGGGIYLYGGTLTLTNCTLSGNFVANSGVVGPGGGGICLDGASTATITGSMFSGNSASADTGGGISGWQGALTINGSTFSGNSAGGSYSYGGGGIYLYRDTLTLNNSTFSGNQAIAGGGGIWVQNGPYYAELLINNSTFSGNSGGGILFGGNVFYLTNTIVAGNTPGDISGGSFGANNLTNGNPLLAPLGNYGGPTQTMPPLPGSPAIGAGSVAANAFSTDQRGYPRTQNGLIDIGAVELQSPAANPPVLENITMPAGGGNGLQFTFTNAPAADFTVLTATNVSLALTNWTVLGEVQQVAPGRYQFTDPQAATNRARFYRVRSP
jgi:hypothetical protein